MWRMRTALSVLLTCWPPAPPARNVVISQSASFTSISASSSTSGSTWTEANVVWRRFCASKGEMRTSRWTPASCFSHPYAYGPLISIVAWRTPTSGPGWRSISTTAYPARPA